MVRSDGEREGEKNYKKKRCSEGAGLGTKVSAGFLTRESGRSTWVSEMSPTQRCHALPAEL